VQSGRASADHDRARCEAGVGKGALTPGNELVEADIAIPYTCESVERYSRTR